MSGCNPSTPDSLRALDPAKLGQSHPLGLRPSETRADLLLSRLAEDGLEYRGRRYRLLSAIATEITRAHWNGRAFLGIRQNGDGAR